MTAAEPVFSVLIPTLNEAENVDGLLARLTALPAIAKAGEILVIDDGSTDGTPERVLGWAERGPVRLIRRSGKPDLTLSILEGAAAARAEPVVVMDADLSHAPEQLPELLEPILSGAADLAIGSRYVAGGAIADWPWRRRLLSRVGSWAAWPLCDVRDPMSGFFATRKGLLRGLGPAAAGYKILFELLMNGTDRARVCEVPIRFIDRAEGVSKLGLKQQATYMRRLAALAGASPQIGTAAWSFLLAMVLDWVALIWLVQGLGRTIPVAAVISFAVPALSLALINHGWFWRRGQIDWGRALRYGVLCALAGTLRDGVLATGQLASPLAAAELAAAAAGAAALFLGTSFFVLPERGQQPPELRWRMAALGILAYSAVLRLAYLAILPPLPGESEPLTALRLASWLLWFPSAAAIALLTGALHGKSAGLRAVLLAAILPWFFLAGIAATDHAVLVALYGLLFASASLAVLRPSPSAAAIAAASALLCAGAEPRALLALTGPLLAWAYHHRPVSRSRCMDADVIVLGGLAGPALLALLLGSRWADIIWSGAVLAPILPWLATSMAPQGGVSPAWRTAAALWPPLIVLLILTLAACLHEMTFGIPPLTAFFAPGGAPS